MVGMSSVPVVKDLVLVGGGHSHVAVLKSLGMRPISGLRATLVSPDPLTPYSGMLPGLMAGHYSVEESHVDLVRLARFAGVDFYRTRVTGIDPERRTVTLEDRPSIHFDVLSINTGSTPDKASVTGAGEYAIPVKPVKEFLSHWRKLEDQWKGRSASPVIAVVGGGAGGVELTLSLEYRLNKLQQLQPNARFHIFHKGPEILNTHNRRVRQLMSRVLTRRNIEVHLNSTVSRVEEHSLTLEDGTQFPCHAVLWVTNASPPPWIRESGLSVDERGFLQVGATLASLSHPYIFGAGDTASVKPYPRPKSGVFAVRQGPPLTRNIRLALYGRAPRKFRPQKQFLSLIGTGTPNAIASRGPFAFEGEWVWKWKDRIDRTWMRQYAELPVMSERKPAGLPDPGLADPEVIEYFRTHRLRCSGCGAKVGKSVLQQSLAILHQRAMDKELKLHRAFLGAEDASLVVVPPGYELVQSVDFFPQLVNDPYTFGRIVAVHALSDLYAMGAGPVSALLSAVIPWQLEDKQVQTLTQLVAGVLFELERCGAELVGGHTSEGPQLAAGLTVNGKIRKGKSIPKSNISPGQKLILTKPLGTGVIMAAEMRGVAAGAHVGQAMDCMLLSNKEAAGVAANFSAAAMTDITGFGLIGHLAEMCDTPKCGIELNIAAIPILDGAIQYASQGISSSMAAPNRQLRSAISNFSAFEENPRLPLLFDPQTSGGLLIAVDDGQASDCLAALKSVGFPSAAIIGHPRKSSESGISLISE